MFFHNELDAAFVRGRAANRTLLIPYLTAGFPSTETFVDVACSLFEAGADALEIGIPFSDPLLDGAAIQRSQQQALANWVTPADAIRFAGEIHERNYGPLLLMGAFNPMLAHGLDAFVEEAAAAGVTGLIVPDLPLSEQGELEEIAAGREIHVIQMVAPTSTDERLKQLGRSEAGFVYCVSVAGVTGARGGVSASARPLVERVRRSTDLPVAVGFGIAGPEQAGEVAEFADGVIVGSALINVLADSPSERAIEAGAEFIRSLRAGIDAADDSSARTV